MLVGESSAEEVGEVTLGNGLLKGLESLFDVWDDTLKKSSVGFHRFVEASPASSRISTIGLSDVKEGKPTKRYALWDSLCR